jgi:hypothetical protein
VATVGSVFILASTPEWLPAPTIIFGKNTDAKGRGSDLTSATQTNPIRTRANLGAVLPSLLHEFENLKITRFRGL